MAMIQAPPGSLIGLPVSVARRNLKTLFLLLVSLIGLLVLSDKLPSGGNLLQLESWKTPAGVDASLESNVTLPSAPLTSLGYEADLVYEAMGSTDRESYRIELETFLQRSFPNREVNQTDPDSLISILHEYLPIPPADPPAPHPQTAFRRLLLFPPLLAYSTIKNLVWPSPPALPKARPLRNIPENIYQTSWFPGSEPPPDKLPPKTWKKLNPDYTYRYFDNDAADAFMVDRFNQTHLDPKRDKLGFSLADTYHKMRDVPVMQSDFWRYAVLASEGGVYSDLDTRCLKAIDGWHRFPWQRQLTIFQNEPRPRPSIIVGIEVDVGTRPDWHKWWPRPLGIVQWTMASSRGHPIMLDTLRRVSEAVNPYIDDGQAEVAGLLNGTKAEVHRHLDAVVEKSGPGPFTDSVLRYLGAKYNVTWPALQSLPNEGILYTDVDGHADVLVLSITAFSPGIGQFGAGDLYHASALVHHLFSGSWKAQHG